ncbi:MAG: sulfate/thiosulfate transport system ATP-binding protein, partial [Pseudonocardiales bacterium]|nr:sulfate/thiosulfate transport system ATP-binding protein [Pseudonocardiales bacterium]
GAIPAQVVRLQRVGFEVRVEMATAGEGPTLVQLTRAQSEALNLHEGTSVWLQAIPNSTSLAS